MKRLLALLVALTCNSALADVEVHHGWARATPPGTTSGAAYLTLSNGGDRAVTLERAETDAAAAAELHQHQERDGVMRMRRVEGGIEIPAGGHVALQPGGYHLMLMGLKGPLKAGDAITLELHFSDGSDRRLRLPVRKAAPMAGMAPRHDANHQHAHQEHRP